MANARNLVEQERLPVRTWAQGITSKGANVSPARERIRTWYQPGFKYWGSKESSFRPARAWRSPMCTTLPVASMQSKATKPAEGSETAKTTRFPWLCEMGLGKAEGVGAWEKGNLNSTVLTHPRASRTQTCNESPLHKPDHEAIGPSKVSVCLEVIHRYGAEPPWATPLTDQSHPLPNSSHTPYSWLESGVVTAESHVEFPPFPDPKNPAAHTFCSRRFGSPPVVP
jgi:hypothetical protein